jgi:hypothetical protein
MMNTKVENPIRLRDIFGAQDYMPRRFARRAQFVCTFVGDEVQEKCEHSWDIPSQIEHDAIENDLRHHIMVWAADEDEIIVEAIPLRNGIAWTHAAITARIGEGADSWHPLRVNITRNNTIQDTVEGLFLVDELHRVVIEICANILKDLKEARA